ncbi:MAG: NAD-dependent epimerase/dehydratase family protein [Ignavibacteriales bacterium]
MKVLLTGSKGFIGRNMLVFLRETKDVEVIEFNVEDEFSKIKENIDTIDFIFHFAGINRPKDVSEFYEGNTNLTKDIINLLNEKNKKIPLIYSSSIQAELDNDYGKSKKQAEDYIINNYKYGIIYRFHNVFGKWCRPNYNSVVATFCYNIANDLPIQINDKKTEIQLIYIDDICKELISLVTDNNKTNIRIKKQINYIKPVKKITLGNLSKLIYSFRDSMRSIYTPETGNEFIKKLYSTYISYVPIDQMHILTKKNVDDRGSFTEINRTLNCGQFSVSISKPNVIRGNHYHNTKVERFIVIKGIAKIKFEHVVTGEKVEFVVDENNIEIVTIPVGYTHNIENIGDGEMILLIWCNELFDPENPDTFYLEIK